MIRRTLPHAALLAALTVTKPGSAEPRNTVWLEDVRLEPKGAAETAFVYEFQTPDLKAIEEGSDLFSLRLGAGVAEALELAPVVRLRQRGNEALRIHEIGGEGRFRVLGDAAVPLL